MTPTIQDLIEQWRGIAKAQAATAAGGGPPMYRLAHDLTSKAFTRCADDLEKVLVGIVSPTGGGVTS